MSQQVAALKDEHSSMLKAIDILYEAVKHGADWASVPRPMRELIAQLERHEKAESTLMRDFFRRGA